MTDTPRRTLYEITSLQTWSRQTARKVTYDYDQAVAVFARWREDDGQVVRIFDITDRRVNPINRDHYTGGREITDEITELLSTPTTPES